MSEFPALGKSKIFMNKPMEKNIRQGQKRKGKRNKKELEVSIDIDSSPPSFSCCRGAATIFTTDERRKNSNLWS